MQRLLLRRLRVITDDFSAFNKKFLLIFDIINLTNLDNRLTSLKLSKEESPDLLCRNLFSSACIENDTSENWQGVISGRKFVEKQNLRLELEGLAHHSLGVDG